MAVVVDPAANVGEERERLETLIRKGKSPARRVLKARILLKADVSEAGKGWSDNRIIEALETNAAPAPRVKAILYVRQSSTHQVMHNQESRLLQYAMRDRLCALARCAHGRTRLYRGRAAAAANAGFRASVITKPSSLVGSACLAIFEVLTAARKSRWRPDCLAGHVRFELRNVVTNYPFERSHRFAGIQPIGAARKAHERDKRATETRLCGWGGRTRTHKRRRKSSL